MMRATFLFSVDLEDVRLWMQDGEGFTERVPDNTLRYLNWLDKYQAKTTFFTVGQVARLYPELLQEIQHGGHEIACHSDLHLPVANQTADQFRADLENNLSSLHRAGVKEVVGYRAPIFSLTAASAPWVYPILKEYGISYSSSVLPAKSPLFGWPEFGMQPVQTDSGVWEIPMSVAPVGPLKLPVAGGVYFRVLPRWLMLRKVRSVLRQNSFVTGYFHPYDIDTLQERFMHPGINNSRLYNYLMYVNRSKVFDRLDRLMQLDVKMDTYHSFVKSLTA